MPPQKRPSPNTPTKEEPTELTELTTPETSPPQAKPTKPTEPTAPETAPQTAPTQTEPTIVETAPETAPPQAKTEPPADETAERTPSNWYTDTLRTIVHRALDADKPDIKGALAALTMLAEAEEPTDNTGDIATLLRDARKRAAHAGTHTD